MNRLRDELHADDPVLGEAAQLARSVSIAPPTMGSQQRVWARLRERKRSAAWQLRPAFVVAFAILLVAVAGAASRLWGRRTHAVSDEARATLGRPDGVARQAAEVAPSPAPSVAAPAELVPPSAPQHKKASRGGVITSPAAVPPPAVAEAEGATPTPRDDDPEAIWVLNAARALRRDHDAGGALRLLARYRDRFPHGDLIEESLALVIEAKAMLNDAGAAAVAEEYLRRFPDGRFRAEALEAVRRFAR